MKPLPEELLNPFGRWCKSKGLGDAEVSQILFAEHAVSCSPRYIRFIKLGNRTPSYRVAKALSLISGGAVSADEILEYRRPDRSAA